MAVIDECGTVMTISFTRDRAIVLGLGLLEIAGEIDSAPEREVTPH
jgi:hypothetical protein